MLVGKKGTEKVHFCSLARKCRLASFCFHQNPNFKKTRKTAKNKENPRKSRVFRLASFLSRYIVGGFRNFALCANIRTLYAWQASLPISEWRMRTGFCCARRARRARFDERVAPPTNEKSNPVGLLRSLARLDKKDAIFYWGSICCSNFEILSIRDNFICLMIETISSTKMAK